MALLDISAPVDILTDTLIVHLLDAVHVVNPKVDRSFGMSLEWEAIIVPTIASLIVFAIGIAIDRCRKAKEKKEETIVFRDTLFKWIDLIRKPVESQIEILRKFSDAISRNKVSVHFSALAIER